MSEEGWSSFINIQRHLHFSFACRRDGNKALSELKTEKQEYIINAHAGKKPSSSNRYSSVTAPQQME